MNGLIEPTAQTLARYGISITEWRDQAQRQGWVCWVCSQAPKGRLVIDHEHSPRWKHRPPEERKRYWRGLLCSFCNFRMIPKGMTLHRSARITLYLQAYEARRPNLPLPKVVRRKKKRRGNKGL